MNTIKIEQTKQTDDSAGKFIRQKKQILSLLTPTGRGTQSPEPVRKEYLALLVPIVTSFFVVVTAAIYILSFAGLGLAHKNNAGNSLPLTIPTASMVATPTETPLTSDEIDDFDEEIRKINFNEFDQSLTDFDR